MACLFPLYKSGGGYPNSTIGVMSNFYYQLFRCNIEIILLRNVCIVYCYSQYKSDLYIGVIPLTHKLKNFLSIQNARPLTYGHSEIFKIFREVSNVRCGDKVPDSPNVNFGTMVVLLNARRVVQQGETRFTFGRTPRRILPINEEPDLGFVSPLDNVGPPYIAMKHRDFVKGLGWVLVSRMI